MAPNPARKNERKNVSSALVYVGWTNVDHNSFVSYGSCISILESANLSCGNFPQAVHGTSVPSHYKEVPLFFANKLLVIKLDLGHFPEQQY